MFNIFVKPRKFGLGIALKETDTWYVWDVVEVPKL